MEDPESMQLLGKDYKNEEPKTYSSIMNGSLLLSILCLTAYFSKDITQANFFASSNLQAQAPEPVKTVSYNGAIYASLGGGDPASASMMCQSDRYLSLPPGWVIAPDDADSIQVTASNNWNTHVNVMSNGCGYGTATYSRGAKWNCNMLGQSGNGYKTNACHLMILIKKSGNGGSPKAAEPTKTVTYNGKLYASLGGGDPASASMMCQSDRYLSLPDGWSLAPDDADSRQVTAVNNWNTHVNVMSNGCGYGTATYTRGAQWNCNMLGQSGNGYKTNACSLMILIVKNGGGGLKYPKAAEPTKSVTYNGKLYASLGGGDPASASMMCQSDRYLSLPDGWSLAPDDADSRQVTASNNWNTHVNVMSNGCGYGTATYTRGAQWNCNMLGSDSGGYKTNSCSLMILITKVAPAGPSPTMAPTAGGYPQAPEPVKTVSYNGAIYASLGGGDPASASMMCQSDRYLVLPNGWSLAPDDADSRQVTASNNWNTHVNVMSNGCGYGTATYTRGAQWSCNMLGSLNGAYKTNACHLMILIKKSANDLIKPVDNGVFKPVSSVAYKGFVYASLGNGLVDSQAITCQNTPYMAVPNGWAIAPDDADSRYITSVHPWNTHVNVMSNGCGYGTATYTRGQLWNCNMLRSVGNEYATGSCALRILIRKADATQNPTPSPSLNPTRLPTIEPTKKPTLAPTMEPSKNPTLAPSMEPSLQPTLQPSLEPTLFPSFQSTNAPTSKPTTPFPSFSPTSIPVEKESICSFEFVKGESSEDVGAGCMLLTKDDLWGLKEYDTTHALYACATVDKPAKLDPAALAELGIDNHISNVIPGETSTVTMYETSDFSGEDVITFDKSRHTSLVNVHFKSGEIANDHVNSLILSSTSKDFVLSPNCVKPDEALPEGPKPGDNVALL